MTLGKKFKGSVIAAVGYILSPFSWWNDPVVNIPLAYLFGTLFGLLSKSLFSPFVVIGYWLSNITGLILMHSGIKGVLSKEQKKYDRHAFFKDFVLSIGYTIGVILLIKVGILKFPTDYFKPHNN